MLSVKDFSIPRLLVRIVMLCLAITLFMPQQIAKATPAEDAHIVTLTSLADVAHIPVGENHVHIYNEAPLYQLVELSALVGTLPDYLPTISPYGSLVFEADGPFDIFLHTSTPLEGQQGAPAHVEVLYHSEGPAPASVKRGRQ